MAEIHVVLVEPQGARNIGAVARVMLNFGTDRLRLVRPDADHLAEEARRVAVRSAAVLENASLFPGLAEAVADCHLVIGTAWESAARSTGGASVTAASSWEYRAYRQTATAWERFMEARTGLVGMESRCGHRSSSAVLRPLSSRPNTSATRVSGPRL